MFVKRNGSGDWYVYDSERGIVAGDDPYLLLNSVSAEVTNTDYIDPLSSGFTVTSSAPAALNSSGDTYIFLQSHRRINYVGISHQINGARLKLKAKSVVCIRMFHCQKCGTQTSTRHLELILC